MLRRAHNFRDIQGGKFGRLFVMKLSETGGAGKTKWICQCDCGNTVKVSTNNLVKGHTQSCGCLQKERVSKTMFKHGKSGTPIYKTWVEMIRRCYNSSYPKYHLWGGRGIRVCQEWLDSFEIFYGHVSLLPDFSCENRTLDRTDNNGNYEPGNVRWATASQQQRNTRSNHLITYKGQTECIAQWSILMDMDPSLIRYRLKKGWSIDKVFETPVKKQLRKNK